MPSMPAAVAVDPGTHKVYVATPDDDAIQVVDPSSKQIVGTIASATHPVVLRIDPGRHRLYSANYAQPNGDGGSIEVIDLNTGQVTATIPAGDRPMLAVDTQANIAYSISKKDFGLLVIDPDQATVISTVAIPHDDMSGLSSMVVDPTNHTLYVTDVVKHTVSTVDPQTGALTHIADVSDQPQEIGVDPTTHLVYTLDSGIANGSVSVIDPSSRQKLAQIGVGYQPSSIAIDSATNFGYVTNNDGSTSVIDLASRSLISNVGAGHGSVGAAVDPQSHTVYVANVAEKSVTVIEPSGQQ